MANIGIGLGAFMDGFARGQAIRDQREDRALQRQEHQEDRARLKAEQQRIDDQRAAYRSIGEDTKAQFQSSGGTNFQKFWTDYALPKYQQQMLLDGNIEGAQKLGEWGQSAAAKEGGELFASALLKAQMGNYNGAWEDAEKAASVKGYLNHGLIFEGFEDIVDEDGNVIGQRATARTEDGQELVQDMRNEDVAKFIATYLNPAAAFESQQAAAADTRRRKNEIDDYREKKKIDQSMKDPGADYARVRKELLENSDPYSEGGEDFSTMSAEEQDKRIREVLAREKAYASEQLGITSPKSVPQKKQVIVDRATGDPIGLGVNSGAPAPQSSQPAQKDGVEIRDLPPPADTRPHAGAAYAREPAPQAAKAEPKRGGRPRTAGGASADLAAGVPIAAITNRLKAAGVPTREWPEDVRNAVRDEHLYGNPVGLGR